MRSDQTLDSEPAIPIPSGISCQQHQKNGEDIRLVNYPFLLTLLTFRFHFELRGRWLRWQRVLRLMLAGFLSSSLGWLGFPFCIVATPRLLFGLASGTGIHRGNNARLLRELSAEREAQGDLDGAIRCMEDSFQYLDDLWGRQELRRLYGLRGAAIPRGKPVTGEVLALPGVLLAALLLGNLVGGADYFLMGLLDQLKFPLLDVLVGWLALSGLGVPAALLLRELVQGTLACHDRPGTVFSLAFGLTAGLLLVVGVLAGRGLGNFAVDLWNDPTRLPNAELRVAIGAGLTRGWLLELYRLTSLPSYLTHGIFVAMLSVYALFAGAAGAREISNWKSKLADIAFEEPTGQLQFAAGWLALLITVAGTGLFSVVVPQKAHLDFVEARDAYRQGVDLEYAERYDEAIPQFEQAIYLDAYMAEAYEELAWVYYQKGDAPQAIRQAKRSIEINPNRGSVHYYLGNIYYFEEDNQKAFEEFERAIVLNPGYYDAYIGSGWAAYALGDLTRAELSFMKALDHSDQPYDAYIGLGKIYEDRGKTAQAIETYQKANQTDVTSATADVYLGLAYLKRNDLSKAAQYLENAVSKDPSNRTARTYLLMSYIDSGRFADAVRSGSESIDRFPKRAGLRALLATALYENGDEQSAIQQLDLAMAFTDQSVMDYDLLIHSLLRIGYYAEAEAEAQRAIAANPERGDFYIDLSTARMSQGDFDGALEAADRAELAGTKTVDALLQRARIYLIWGKRDLSQEELAKAQKLEPDNANVHTLLGRIYYEQGDLEQALQETRRTLELDGYNLDGYINLGFILLEIGNGAEAIQAGAQAEQLSPNLDAPHFIMGMGYLNTGQDSAAYTELNRYLQLSQTSAGAEKMREQAEKALQSLRKIY